MKNEHLLNDLLIEIENLRKAQELLETIFYELGPYKNRKIKEETWEEVNQYFNFDDSE